MLNASHLSRESVCPGCGVTYTFQDGVTERVCTYCKNTVYAPEDQVNVEQMESLLAEGDKLCNALEFREAWYYYRRAKELDPSCVKAYWGLIRAAYGVQIVYEDKTEKRYVLSTIRVSQDVDQCEEWHLLRAILHRQPSALSNEYDNCIKAIRAQQQNMKTLWNKGWKGEYDIFLCYKETERYEDPATGKVNIRPSKDQEWVRAFYEELDRQNSERAEPFRIFYAPVTLSNAVGDPYAAHLSHALMTSRIMLLMGTQPEYFDTSWVLGERTRFYHYMEEENDSRKIIPVFNHLLAGGRTFEEVIPREYTDIQGIDVANDMKAAVRNVLTKCAGILTQNQGKQPGPCQHAVREREYDNVCNENVRMAREAAENEKKLEDVSRAKEILEQNRAEITRKLNEALDRNAVTEGEIRTKDEEIRKINNEKDVLERSLDSKRREAEFLQERNRELLEQKTEAIADARKNAEEINGLRKDLEIAHRDADRFQEQKQVLLEQKTEAIADARKKADEINGLSNKLEIAHRDVERLQEQKQELQGQIRELQIQNGKLEVQIRELLVQNRDPEIKIGLPPQTPPPLSPPPPEPPFKCRDEYGFRVSSDPNGVKSFSPDLMSLKKEELRHLSKIDQIYVSVMARNQSVTVTGRLEGLSGQYSEESRAVTLPPNRARDICFGLGNIPLSQFDGAFVLTLTDQHGRSIQKTLKLRGR